MFNVLKTNATSVGNRKEKDTLWRCLTRITSQMLTPICPTIRTLTPVSEADCRYCIGRKPRKENEGRTRCENWERWVPRPPPPIRKEHEWSEIRNSGVGHEIKFMKIVCKTIKFCTSRRINMKYWLTREIKTCGRDDFWYVQDESEFRSSCLNKMLTAWTE